MEKDKFERGNKVLYTPEQKIYDFGYISDTGYAIIYKEGERSFQDSYAVHILDLIKID